MGLVKHGPSDISVVSPRIRNKVNRELIEMKLVSPLSKVPKVVFELADFSHQYYLSCSINKHQVFLSKYDHYGAYTVTQVNKK